MWTFSPREGVDAGHRGSRRPGRRRNGAPAAAPNLVVRRPCSGGLVGGRSIDRTMARYRRSGADDPACRLHGDHCGPAAGSNGRQRHLRSAKAGPNRSMAGRARDCCSELWELASAKLNLLPRPFFAAPQSLLEVYTDDWLRLADSTAHSLMLLVTGYVVGAVLGFISGVAIGWSRAVGYWMHPMIRFVGPLPATAWLPLAFFVFPSSWSAGVFLIALATGFPVTVLTWSGVASVNAAYYDVARTLGASPRLPDPQGRHPGRDAVGVCRTVHGPWRVVRGAGRGGDDGGEVRAGLVPELGTRLGRLFQHVRGADRDGADVQRGDHAAVPPARSAAVLAEGSAAMVVAAGVRGAPVRLKMVAISSNSMGGRCPCSMRSILPSDPANSSRLLGPSGCGKSTLLRLIAGLERPHSGRIFMGGQEIEAPGPSRILVFQDPTLYPWRTVRQNVALGLEARGLLRAKAGASTRCSGRSGLTASIGRIRISSQAAWRSARRLARALVNEPSVLLMDEPLANLDSLTRIAHAGRADGAVAARALHGVPGDARCRGGAVSWRSACLC